MTGTHERLERMSARPMQFSVVLGQRASWPELLRRTRVTEELGFDGLLLVDHFYGLFDLDDPTHEAYTMLAALAPFTSRLKLGVMVTGNTYRNPVFLLKQAITVDHISNGRVIFGVGAGWVQREHEAYSFEYPSAGERVSRFAEALEIWRQLQANQRTTFEGEHYQLLDAPFAPKSLQPGGLPLLIGGSGPRMLKLTAEYADIWNGIGTPKEVGEQNRRVDAACAAAGRNPASLSRAVSPSINLLASPDAFETGVREYQAQGFDHITFPWPRVEAEEPVLREVARSVLPRFRGEADVEPSSAQSRLREPSMADVAILREWVASVRDGDAYRALDYLARHPDQRLDGAALLPELGFESHREVTRSFALLGRGLAERGLARLWNEAQRGYLMSSAQAGLLRQAGG
ncbi:MAG: LLM class flavin-dependent oxidoreductase [Rhizobiales bacterium]|nr:LLM class flavin-dependent oxidoreductase [Hyphomicrobiales bacterium]